MRDLSFALSLLPPVKRRIPLLMKPPLLSVAEVGVIPMGVVDWLWEVPGCEVEGVSIGNGLFSESEKSSENERLWDGEPRDEIVGSGGAYGDVVGCEAEY